MASEWTARVEKVSLPVVVIAICGLAAAGFSTWLAVRDLGDGYHRLDRRCGEIEESEHEFRRGESRAAPVIHRLTERIGECREYQRELEARVRRLESLVAAIEAMKGM